MTAADQPAEVELDWDGTPLEPWQRPPFRPGHTLSLKHGAYSPRRVEPLAEELVESTLAAAADRGSVTAYLSEPSYRPSLWAWARAEAKVQLLTEWLMDRGGDLDEDGEVRSAAALLERVERRAVTLRARLGLDPLSRAKLGRDVAAGSLSVAQLMSMLGDDPGDEEGDGDGVDE